MHALTVGTRIGPYVLEEPIGSGATAQVYRARRTEDGLQVALKLMATSTEDAHGRFVAEVAALRRVSHPGVVEVVEAGEHEARWWLAMELVEGVPLDDWVGRVSGTTRMRHILLAGVEVADALAAVHDHGLLHRDLKPANILVRPSGRVKLVDFGFAGHVDAQGDAGLAGTLRYMAPERLTGSVTDQRADLFSLGVILFELLARRPPHVGLDRNRLILAQCTEPAPSVAEFAPEVPQAALDIVDHMLAKVPGERPRSAHDVAEALRRALGGEPRPSHWRPVLRTSRFVGHRTLLDGLVKRAMSGAPATVLLHGPRGIGLSRILQEVQGRVLVRGGRPVLVRGGRRLLFRVLDSLAGALRPADMRRKMLGPDRDLMLAAWPDLGRASEDVISLSRPPTPTDLANAVRGVLLRAAELQSLVVAVDDADLADSRDLSLLQGAGLLLLATHEPSGVSLVAERLPVPPLDRAQLGSMAASMLGRTTGPRLVMEHAATVAGLPGRLVAVARGELQGRPSASAGVSETSARIRPWESAVQEAEAAMADRSPEEALDVLAEAATSAPSPDLLFRAELVRSLAALQAGNVEAARRHAVQAAEVAPTPADRSEARLAEARAALRAEDLAAVTEIGRLAATAADRMGEKGLATRWRVLTARANLRAGGLRAASESLRPDILTVPTEPAAAMGVAWTSAEIAVHQCDWSGARSHLLAAREQASAGQGRRARAGLRAEVGHLWLRRGEIDKAVEQLERAHQDLALTADTELLALVRARLAEARLLGGEVDEAGRLVTDAIRTADQARSAFASQEAIRVALRHARVASDLGRLGELVDRAEDLLLQRPRDPWGAAMAAQTALGRLELGDEQAAERWLQHAVGLAPEDPYHRQVVRLARIALRSRGDSLHPDAALKVADSARQLGLDHLARVALGFTARWTGSAEGRQLSRMVSSAKRSGDRYASCWLSIALETDRSAVRKARALGYLAMAEGRALPA